MTRLRHVLTACLLACAASPALAVLDPPVWLHDYQKTFKLARERRQPIAIVFGLSTTKATHELNVRLREDPALVKALDGFARVELEEPDQGIAASVYGIWVVPTLVVLDRYEREVGRLTFPQADDQWHAELLAMCARAQDPSSNVMPIVSPADIARLEMPPREPTTAQVLSCGQRVLTQRPPLTPSRPAPARARPAAARPPAWDPSRDR